MRRLPAKFVSGSLPRFLWAQLGQFVGLLAAVCGLGLGRSLWRRTFDYRAALGGLGAMLAGSAAVARLCCRGGPQALDDAALFAGLAAVALGCGWLIGKVGRRLGFWEVYFTCGITALVWWLQLTGRLGSAWRRLMLRYDQPAWANLLGDGALDTFSYVTPGHRWLGPMWDRACLLAIFCGFLLALCGASLGHAGLPWRPGRGMGFELMVARRQLRGLRPGGISLTALVATLGVTLGVASLIVVNAVMSGYQQDIESRILSTNAHLLLQKYGNDFADHARVLARARQVAGVVAATPFAFNEAMLSGDSDSVGVMLKGIEPASAGAVTGIETHLLGGAGTPRTLEAMLPAQGGPPWALLGELLLQRLGKGRGDVVLLTVPSGTQGGHMMAPRRLAVRIAGSFRSGMYDFDARLVYVRLETAQTLLGLGDNVSGLELRLAEPRQVDRVATAVYRAVGRYPYTTRGWQEINAPLFTALRLQKIVMFLVLCCIVIVASFNIASTLFMAVVERARDIAVLKSMGARDPQVMQIFMLQGFWVGICGTVCGTLLGLCVALLLGQINLSIAADVYMVESLRVRVQPVEVCVVVGAALVIAHLATLYPAMRAASQAPAEVMRYD